MMNSNSSYKALTLAAMMALVSCAEPAAKPVAVAAASGSHFSGQGRVSLYRGRPCTPQIMFEFRARRSSQPVLLAAGMKPSRTLTDAARAGKPVRISGVWKRGKEKSCSYVDVGSVTPD